MVEILIVHLFSSSPRLVESFVHGTERWAAHSNSIVLKNKSLLFKTVNC